MEGCFLVMQSPFRKIKGDAPHLVLQALCAVVYIAFVLFCLSITDSGSPLLWAIGAGALSSSCYIVFVTPHSAVACSRRIIGGYFIGIVTGLIMHIILTRLYMLAVDVNNFHTSQVFWVSAAVTVGLAMTIMVLFGMEHPPAVGVSLVLVLHLNEYDTLLIILAAAILLATLRWLLRRWLIDLV